MEEKEDFCAPEYMQGYFLSRLVHEDTAVLIKDSFAKASKEVGELYWETLRTNFAKMLAEIS